MKSLNRMVLGAAIFFAAASFMRIPVSVADDWLPIDPADLALKDNPKNPGADAMMLYRERKVNEPKAYSREYTRMKIFTKEGAKYGNIEIPYEKDVDSIIGIRGRTIHPDGKIIDFGGKVLDKVMVKTGGLRVYVKSFSLPAVQPGSIIEYRYQDQLNEQRYYIGSESWTPQGELFTRLVRFSILPLSGMSAEGLQLSYRVSHFSEQVKLEQQSGGYLTVELHDVPGVADEELMPPKAAIRPRIEFFYRDRNEPASETKEQYWRRIDKNWDRILEKFVDKKGALQAELSRITRASDSPDLKLRKIYARVEQIRNLNLEPEKTRKEQKSEALKPNSNVEDVLKHSYGTERDINMLFIGLARAAGFDATQVYVAPTNADIFTPTGQEASQLSADIVWVHAGDREYYLDPGARYYPFGMLPWFEAGAQGIRLRKDGPEVVTAAGLTSADATLVRSCDIKIGTHGGATGTISVDYAGELGGIWRTQERNEDETGRKKDFGDEVRGWLPAGATFNVTSISNWDDTSKPVHVEGSFTIPPAGPPAGSRALVPITIFRTRYVDVFKSSTRSNPVDFSYPFQEIDDIKYELPGSYTVEFLPTISKVDLGAAVYDVSVTQQRHTVEVKRHLNLQGIYFAVKFYSSLRFFFTKAQSNDQTQIVLQSTQSAKTN